MWMRWVGTSALTMLMAMNSASSQSPPPSDRIQLANRVLDGLQFDKTIERFATHQSSRLAADSAALGRWRKFERKYFDMPKMRLAAAAKYAELFTATELTELAQFLESPAGSKYVELQPRLAEAIQPVIAAAFRDHFEEFRHDVLGLP